MYKALLIGGGSGFNALLGGGRDENGRHGWKPTDSTGLRLKRDRARHVSTTSPQAVWLCTVKPVARSREHFPSGVSGSEDFQYQRRSVSQRVSYAQLTRRRDSREQNKGSPFVVVSG